MKIKRFVGRSLKEATDQMKKELGDEAIILNSRRVNKGGTFNLLGKEMFEVTAAIDEEPAPRHNTYARRTAAESFERASRPGHVDRRDDDPVESLRRLAENFQQRSRPEREGGTVSRRVAEGAEMAELKNDMQDVKGVLKDIVEQLKHSRMPALPDSLKKAYTTLVQHEVEERLAAELVQSVYAALNREQLCNKQITDASLLAAIANVVKLAEQNSRRRKRTRVVALVGPTGVGKTTTIAKLAAISKLLQHQEVALVSADTYRIGAIEQLRTFATIADIPMEVAYKPAEIGSALRKFRNKDVVFVDTVGRSQRSRKELNDLAKFVGAAAPDETHLVLNASTNVRTSLEVIDQFKTVAPDRLLFSKLDEAATFGPLLTIMSKHQLPVSYLTTGQAVPDDIVPFDPARFARMVYTGALGHA
jgi:flagellar biosynthesis protein FlhF